METAKKKITIDILKEAVANKYGVEASSVIISDLTFAPGSKKGDGFACDVAAVVFRATFNGKDHDENMIAKCGPDGARGDILRQVGLYEHECPLYTWVVPRLQKIRESKSLPPLAFPECYFAAMEKQILLMENLKLQKYIVIPKKLEPLSLHAIKLILKELAAFHATGLYFINTYPGGLDTLAKEFPLVFDKQILSKTFDSQIYNQFYQISVGLFHNCVLVCQKYGSEEMGKRMADFESQVVLTSKRHFMSADGIFILTHGDAWYNNFMFRFEEEAYEPDAIKILDLQGTRLNRLGTELNYFFCSSMSPKQRKEHLDELLQFYYKNFRENFTKLDGRMNSFFSFDDLKKEFSTCYDFGLISGCNHAQGLIIKDNPDSDLDLGSVEDEQARNKMIQGAEKSLMENAANSPDFLQMVLGLAQEAMDRNVI